MLADEGCDIAFIDSNEEFSSKVAKEVNRKNKTLLRPYKFDLTNEDDITRLRFAVNCDFGHVDILINNSEVTESNNVDKMIKTNIYGTIMASHQVSMSIDNFPFFHSIRRSPRSFTSQ